MRNVWTKSLAVTAVSGMLVFGGAGVASAHDGGHTEKRSNETDSQVEDNRIEDSGNISLDDVLNGSVDVGDVASDNHVLNGNDTDVDTDTSADSNKDHGEDNEGGLLGGLL